MHRNAGPVPNLKSTSLPASGDVRRYVATCSESTNIRSSIRFFAYFVGNGTLGAVFNEFPDYDPLLESEDFLPSLIAVFVNNLNLEDQRSIGPAQKSAWQLVMTRLDPKFKVDPQYGEIESDPKHHQDYRQDICRFADHLASHTIPNSRQKGIDYWLTGSGLELLFAVYCNVAELDGGLRVSNHDFACRRVDLMVESDDVVLDSWETELH